MNYPKVSIIILNWNGLEDTIECLESLKKITYPNYEVIVVDNGSEGNDAQVLEERFGDYIHLIQNDKNYGFAGGNNIAMRYALNNSNPDYLLLLNNDTVVDPEFVTEMVKVAETDPAIDVAGPKIYYYDEPDRLEFVVEKIDLWKMDIALISAVIKERIIGKKNIDKEQYEPAREVDVVSGCCFLIKRKTLENIGFLDEEFVCGYEDWDYCLRAKKADYKIFYVPEAKVWHKGGRSLVRLAGIPNYYRVRGNFRLTRKHATKWQYRFFLVFFFGIHLWLATAYHLIWLRQPKALLSLYKGVRDELANLIP